MPITWPLTGRAEELALGTGLVRGAGSGVVLAGAAGVGKTRLAREILAAASGHNVVTRWTVATESARPVPLGALMLLTGVTNPIRQVDHALDALTAVDDGQRLVIGVDDAHLLDAVSALVVQQVALSGRAGLVLTVRSGEPAPDAVMGLWKDGHLRRLELQALSAVESRGLLEAVLGGPLDVASSQRLWAATQGNPLYLRALAEGEKAAGRLRRSGGIWQWRGQPRLSPELSDLMTHRLGDLSEAERSVVDVLAFGEPLELDVIDQLADRAAVEMLEGRGLVEVITGPDTLMVRLGHPLYGEAWRTRCGTARGRRVRSRIATVLAVVAEKQVLRRGVLALDADLPVDPQLLTAAAEVALGLPELFLAERLARAAAAAGAGFPAHLALVSALVALNRPAQAELRELTNHAGNDAERVQAAVLRATQLLVDARPTESIDVLDDATATVSGGAARAELQAVTAAAVAVLGHPDRATAMAALAQDTGTLSAECAAFAAWSQVMAFGVLGRIDDLDAAATLGLGVLERAPAVRWLALPLMGHQLLGLRLAGLLPQALQIAERFRASYGDKPFGAEGSSLMFGMAELAAGRITTALRWLTEARAGLQTYPPNSWLALSLIDITRAHALRGEPQRARETFAQLESTGRHLVDYLRTEAILAEAWVLAAEGVTSRAITRTRQAADFARNRGMLAHEVLALHDATRLGDHSTAGRLTDLAEHVGGPFAAAAATHATALAAADGARLLIASKVFEHSGMLLRAADSAAHAAAAHTRTGRTGSAQLGAASATRLAAACEGAQTPALRAMATPLPLTVREREIATLIAAGLSNREIAERLTLSVRTVEGHIFRACRRLGVTNRDDLAAFVSSDRIHP